MPEYEDRPRALQFAARIEKVDPPLLNDVFVAAALGVIALLDDTRSLIGGAWHDEVTAWNASRIRKIMRRARASDWLRVQEVPGLTIRHGTAEVRTFVPGHVDEAPRSLSKLQIQSSPLDEPSFTDTVSMIEQPTLVIALNPAVEMSWGKRGAQVGHAAHRSWQQVDRKTRLDWNAAGRPVQILHPTPDLWEWLLPHLSTQIHDGGFTEVAPGTLTAAAQLGAQNLRV